jgi:propanediol utilization protein
VTDKTLATLFGAGATLTNKKDLSQPGQFACEEKVTLVGPKGELKVSILGPTRPADQVELSFTDARTLGLEVPVRLSGDVNGTPGVTLVTERGRIPLRQGCLAAQRHIHLTPGDAKHFGVVDKQTVRLRTLTARPLVFEDVAVRVSPDFASYVHLDYDEANACGFRPGDLGRILP